VSPRIVAVRSGALVRLMMWTHILTDCQEDGVTIPFSLRPQKSREQQPRGQLPRRQATLNLSSTTNGTSEERAATSVRAAGPDPVATIGREDLKVNHREGSRGPLGRRSPLLHQVDLLAMGETPDRLRPLRSTSRWMRSCALRATCPSDRIRPPQPKSTLRGCGGQDRKHRHQRGLRRVGVLTVAWWR
jgi:hypothetical protein